MKEKVCLYQRYSSDNQSENSIEYQRKFNTEFCKSKGYDIVMEYNDEAVTGQKENREEFQKMFADAKSNKYGFTKVNVFAYTRFSRKPDDGLKYYLDYEDLGIEVISINEPLPEGPTKYALLGFFFGMNYSEVRRTSMHTHAGMMTVALNGEVCGGTPLYGYDCVDRYWVLNKNEAEAVKLIFNMYYNGYSYRAMAEELNTKGYRTKTGNLFKKSCFHAILTQVQYTGVKTWNVRSAKKHNLKRNNSEHKPIGEQVRVEGGCPAIITKEMFEEVQTMIAEGRCGKRKGTSYHHYMFSGLKILKCSHCGEYMISYTKMSHGVPKRYYGCPNHEKKICPVTEIRADYVEKFVAYAICLNLINLENVELYKEIIKKFDSNKSLVDKIKGKEKAIENVMAAIERSSNDLLVDRLEVLIEEKIELENKLNQKIGDIASNKESLKSVRKKVQKDLRYKTDIEISNFLKTVITSAEVGMNGFNLTIAA